MAGRALASVLLVDGPRPHGAADPLAEEDPPTLTPLLWQAAAVDLALLAAGACIGVLIGKHHDNMHSMRTP